MPIIPQKNVKKLFIIVQKKRKKKRNGIVRILLRKA